MYNLIFNKGLVMKKIISLFLITLFVSVGSAQIKTELITYQDGEVELEGYLAYDKLLKSVRGGVIIVHNANGRDEFIQERADELAKIGYVVFAVDMFGKGVSPKDEDEQEVLTSEFLGEDRLLMRQRVSKGLEILTQQSKVDVNRLAAIGYGFGGTTVLELARSGANITAAISFFGSLSTPTPEDAKNIKGAVLIHLGSEDPIISKEEIASFRTEMQDANVDWQINLYGGTYHGFTRYSLGFDTSSGKAYNYNADKRSWEAVKSLLHEKLK
jgi:dienelactone hydrolase